jgi:hypothetical protein
MEMPGVALGPAEARAEAGEKLVLPAEAPQVGHRPAARRAEELQEVRPAARRAEELQEVRPAARRAEELREVQPEDAQAAYPPAADR